MGLQDLMHGILAVNILTFVALLVVFHAFIYGYGALLQIAWDVGHIIGAKLRGKPPRASQQIYVVPDFAIPNPWVVLVAVLWLSYIILQTL